MEDKTSELCSVQFSCSSNKKRHVVNQHGVQVPAAIIEKRCLQDVPSVSPFRCTYCDNVFSTASNKRKHEVNVHSAQPDLSQVPTAIICKDCSGDQPSVGTVPVTFKTLRKYRDHLQHQHGIPVNKVDYRFTSFKEFLAWKERLVVDVGVNYSKMRGALKTSTGMRDTYFCRRSGLQRKRVDSSERKCAKKIQSTCKLGLYCTSSIEVRRSSNDDIQVSFYPDHRDHSLDFPSLVHMTLTKSDRERVADMIIQGIEHDKILDQVRESSTGSRLLLIEKEDILNIAAEFGLTKDQMRHPEDSTSVRLIVKEMEEAGEVLYFKDQGRTDINNPDISKNEFVLGFMKQEQQNVIVNQMKTTEKLQVCMDSTHGMSQYSGYQLTTLMTVTDLSHGFPVAFLISSTVNTNIVKTFLNALKGRVGPVEAHVFMSDDDLIFKNAWEGSMCSEFAPKPTYLNCCWHTDRSFRKSIGFKISAPIDEKAVVYEMMRVIMDEPEENNFHIQIQGFLKYLLESGFSSFHDYFKLNYLSEGRIQLWPKCFRKNITITANNHLESMHRLLKYVYLHGKKVKRLDHTITALGKLAKENLFKRMDDLIRNRTGDPIPIKKHIEGMNLEVKENNGLFQVSSETSKDELYEINKSNTNCDTCRDRCIICNVCKCLCTCSGEDNEGGRKIVKHTHAVQEFRKTKTSQSFKPKSSTEEISLTQSSVSDYISDDSIAEKLKSQVESKTILDFLPKLRETKDTNILKSVQSHILKAIALMDVETNFSADRNPLLDVKVKQEIKEILEESCSSTSVTDLFVSNDVIKDEHDCCI